MARHFISTDLTETFFAQADDEIFVTETGSILTEDDSGIANQSYAGFDVSVTVDGSVSAEVFGVYLVGADAGESPTLSTLRVGQTGSVSGEIGAFISSDFDYDIRVAGHIAGAFSGIEAYAHSGQIHVSGLVEGERFGAIRLEDPWGDAPSHGGFHSLTNTGVVRGTEDGVAVYAIGDFDLDVLNTGRIEGISGIVLSSTLGGEIRNFGQIISEDFVGIQFRDLQAPATILNRGSVVGGEHCVLGIDSDVEIVNSGVLSGLIYVSGGHLSIHNSGVIDYTDDIAIRLDFGALGLFNSGGIHGDIMLEDESPAHIGNTGVIYGDIQLAFDDDTYHGRGTGYVTGEVFGYAGDDVLIGGDRSDRLRGEYDNDRLVGKGGRDDLQGGYGDDTLNGGNQADRLDGGRGNDLLTGGNGADVFVFGPDGDTDRIRDFAQGVDLMEITGQPGGFASLTIQDRGDDLEVTYAGGVIVLVDQAGATLTNADFDFV